MGVYVASRVVKLMIQKGHRIQGANVLVLGLTFKENCPDIRNSKVIDLISELKKYGCNVDVYDPWADPGEVRHEYGLELLEDGGRGTEDGGRGIIGECKTGLLCVPLLKVVL